jgi:Fur family peroxide stress response transcriptional regulator
VDVTEETLQERIKECKRICKEKGLKLTHQRMEIFLEIARTQDHPSVEEIYKRVKPRIPTVSLDTVYRTVTTFEHYGIINKLEFLDDRSRFDANTEVHHHLVCIQCKSVQDFYWPFFDKMNMPEEASQWGQVRSSHVEIRGTCKKCMKRKAKEL